MSVKKESKLIKVNGRLITNALVDKSNTFLALCELINNSIQASANNIEINMTSDSKGEMIKDSITSLSIKDDGEGVSLSDFQKKILEIATDIKPKGKGTGRFSVFQFGKTAYFETVAYDKILNNYTKTSCTLNLNELQNGYIDKKVELESYIFNSKKDTYFFIEVRDIFTKDYENYNSRKHKICDALKTENIGLSLFTMYPIEMLDKNIQFFVNGIKIDPKNYQLDRNKFERQYNDYSIEYDVIEHKSKKRKEEKLLCIRAENNNMKNILNYFDIEMDIPYKEKSEVSWHIYVDSKYIDENIESFENIDLKDINIDVKNFLNQIETDIKNFFLNNYEEYFNFRDKLIKNDNYPYKNNISSSKSKEIAFIQIAYSIEYKYKLLSSNNKDLMKIIYPLLDGCLDNPNLKKIINSINTLKEEHIKQFEELIDKTELDEVITFSDNVANKMAFLDFLHEINYSDDISKHILERKQLHKVLEKNLWIFGEQYIYSSAIIESDTNLGKNLERLRTNIMKNNCEEFDEIKSDDNITKITDLFFYSDFKFNKKHEVLVVELKRPSVKLGNKEIEQVKRYGYEISKSSSISKQNVNFKIILIGSSINEDDAIYINNNEPLYKTGNIEIWVMNWADLIKENRDKLTYMSNEIKVKDNYILNNIEKKYPEIDFDNIKLKLNIKNNY